MLKNDNGRREGPLASPLPMHIAAFQRFPIFGDAEAAADAILASYPNPISRRAG
ncbi:hypothetical protein FHX08_003117 [Rhizobium sp. BK529]|nr:hypothetical protein [Rhizobium sp. BK529]TCS07155.1 hypothetical protein EV281_102769 [Rhizobium sp. BK418]